MEFDIRFADARATFGAKRPLKGIRYPINGGDPSSMEPPGGRATVYAPRSRNVPEIRSGE